MADSRKTTKIIHTNWGYWDGVDDRAKHRIAKWYRGAAKNFGHFDPDYAFGYDRGVWGGDPTQLAIYQPEPSRFPKSLAMIEAAIDEIGD